MKSLYEKNNVTSFNRLEVIKTGYVPKMAKQRMKK